MWTDSYKVEYGRQSRIDFARASISRAKMDLIRLAKFDSDVQYMIDMLQTIQNEFRLKYAAKRLK